ncbi:hypothetical protein [Spiroplasma endosymbiont of Polydrusus cervinus]|uniref:hypothetical protein n=1 Tax=Spiroplasma endosymbiont of Polydrusus cervinus TaxID=3066287 RepID=UPI0030CD4068
MHHLNYQSTILDGYTKEIIDVKWSKFNNNKLVIDNLNDAINKIKKIKKDLASCTMSRQKNSYEIVFYF